MQELLLQAAALLALLGASMVDQDATNRLGGSGVEMSPILPAPVSVVRKLQVGLVDQRGCLQGVAISLATERLCSQAMQVCINGRNELVNRARLPARRGIENHRDVVRMLRDLVHSLSKQKSTD